MERGMEIWFYRKLIHQIRFLSKKDFHLKKNEKAIIFFLYKNNSYLLKIKKRVRKVDDQL